MLNDYKTTLELKNRGLVGKTQDWPENYKQSVHYIYRYDIFFPREDKIFYFFRSRNLNYYKYFGKSKSLLRESDSWFRMLITSISSKGRVEFMRLNFLKIYNDYLKEVPYLNLKHGHSLYFLKFMEIFFSLNVFFKYSFHRINKKIRKFSRGRSGKYKVVYNFIPYLKREKFKAKQFKKNMKYVDGKTVLDRLKSTVGVYRYNFKKTTIYYEKVKATDRVLRTRYNSVLLKCR